MSEGWFWRVGGEGRVRGKLTAKSGQDAEVTLSASVAANQALVVTQTDTGETIIEPGSPAEHVAAFAPIDLHGQLDSGELISLLSARNHGVFEPHYVAGVTVLGAHVSSDQLYSAVRFRIDVPYWTAHLVDGENRIVPDDGSVLRVMAPGDGPEKGMWLAYASAQPRSRRDLDGRVLGSCRTLARLALDLPLTVRTIEVRTGPDTDWLPLLSKGTSAPSFGIGQSLLPREALTVERFANWIALNSTLDGLAAAVAELGQGTVESQLLVCTSLVEGLHRRLPYQQSQFPKSTSKARDRVKKAARHAAAEQAKSETEMDPVSVHTAVKDAVGHFEDVGYRARAQDVINEVTSAVPELTESVPDLAGKLMTARNEIAHHLIPNGKESYGNRIDRWVAISYVTPWVLRLLLLLRAGIEPEVLHNASLGSDRLGFTRANVAVIADDLGWLPSADTA